MTQSDEELLNQARSLMQELKNINSELNVVIGELDGRVQNAERTLAAPITSQAVPVDGQLPNAQPTFPVQHEPSIQSSSADTGGDRTVIEAGSDGSEPPQPEHRLSQSAPAQNPSTQHFAAQDPSAMHPSAQDPSIQHQPDAAASAAFPFFVPQDGSNQPRQLVENHPAEEPTGFFFFEPGQPQPSVQVESGPLPDQPGAGQPYQAPDGMSQPQPASNAQPTTQPPLQQQPLAGQFPDGFTPQDPVSPQGQMRISQPHQLPQDSPASSQPMAPNAAAAGPTTDNGASVRPVTQNASPAAAVGPNNARAGQMAPNGAPAGFASAPAGQGPQGTPPGGGRPGPIPGGASAAAHGPKKQGPANDQANEVKAMRALAVIGTIVTVVGLAMGIAVGIQRGWFGPSARLVLAIVISLILFGVGLTLDRRNGPSVGVSAAYVTSYLGWIVVIAYSLRGEHWIGPWTAFTLHAVFWLAYLALATWRRNVALVMSMLIAFALYNGPLNFNHSPTLIVSMVLPIVAFAGSLVAMDGTNQSKNHLMVKITSTAALAGSGLFAFIGLDRAWSWTLAATLSIVAICLAATEIFPQFRVRDVMVPKSRVEVRWTLLMWLPLILSVVASVVNRWTIWAPSLVAVVVFAMLYVFGARAGFPETERRYLHAWTIWTAVSFLFPYAMAWRADEPAVRSALAMTFFAAVAVLAVPAAHRRQLVMPPILGAYCVVGTVLSIDLLRVVFPSASLYEPGAADIWRGVVIIALVVVSLRAPVMWDSLTSERRILMLLVLLFEFMIGVVTAVSGILAAVLTAEQGFMISHLLVSVSWITMAAWLLLTSRSPLDEKSTLGFGVTLALATAAKLVLVDLSQLDEIPRAIAFIFVGLVLIAVVIIRSQRGKPQPTQTETQQPEGFNRQA